MKTSVIANLTKAPASPSCTATLIVQIIILIAKLIVSGCEEQKAFETASSKFNIPVSEVRHIWKKHK